MTDKNAKTNSLESAAGIKLGRLNNVLIGVALLISVALLYSMHLSIQGYHRLTAITERYIACQKDAQQFRESSDYLTNESRSFVVTGNTRHLDNFVEEVEVNRRRETAVDNLDEYLQGVASEHLSRAMECSGALAEVEHYALRLAARGFGIDGAALPASIAAIALTDEDAALDEEAALMKARELTFGEAYTAAKEEIYRYVGESIDALIAGTRAEQVESSSRLSTLLRIQRLLTGLMLVLFFTLVLLTYLLVIRPLQHSVACMREHRQIPVAGSAEMQFLAHTYNDMYEQQTRSTEKLEYSATHDSLTGIYNRTAFDAECALVDQRDIGVLFIDVDKFKQFNDTYGHDVGDRVLQRVAKVIEESFRAEDFVSRIGGDEFCVIMRHTGGQLRDVVAAKLTKAMEKLANPTDGLPKITLSVGVAFGDRDNAVGDIFKDADTALYRVKREGRSGYEFF